jgi:hypothetical protein
VVPLSPTVEDVAGLFLEGFPTPKGGGRNGQPELLADDAANQTAKVIERDTAEVP